MRNFSAKRALWIFSSWTAPSELVRGEIEQDGRWEILSLLSPPRSVGLLLAKRTSG